MQSGTQEYVLATYREIAVRFGLSGPNAARLKTKRLGWRPSKPNRAGEVFRIRVPREVWEQQPEGKRAGPPRPLRRARRPGQARHLDDGGEMRAIQKLIDTLEKQRERNRSRAGTPDTQSTELMSKL
ncbi:MAG: hypothetical protein JOZ58_19365, partial [Acetobacteraceae bacterium]|nr:hypothetical protein [Acetobacteraceae bacterium]